MVIKLSIFLCSSSSEEVSILVVDMDTVPVAMTSCLGRGYRKRSDWRNYARLSPVKRADEDEAVDIERDGGSARSLAERFTRRPEVLIL